jgi:hypothetical protein
MYNGEVTVSSYQFVILLRVVWERMSRRIYRGEAPPAYRDRMSRNTVRLAVGALSLTALLVAGAGSVAALEADEIGVMPVYESTGSSGAFEVTATWPESSGVPPTTIASDASRVQVPNGAGAFLGADTGFGQKFGSTLRQPYVNINAAPRADQSTTDIVFEEPTPDGWGFALGDVDADWLFIRAWQDTEQTIPLTVDQLGFQEVGNYCMNSPRPSGCTGGDYTDQPVWVEAPGPGASPDPDDFIYQPGTLRGNSSLEPDGSGSLDTYGAYGWFQPTVPVASMELLYGERAGSPVFQLWMAAPAPVVTIEGTVEVEDGDVPEGTVVQIQEPTGEPVLGLDAEPLEVPVAEDGAYTVELPQQPEYQLAVIPPAGFDVPEPFTVAGVLAEGETSVTAPAVVVAPAEPEPTPEPTEPTPTPEPTEPEPTPTPAEPTPSPTATTPAPAPEPEPTEAAPVAPAPVEPAPEAAPTAPVPLAPADSGDAGLAVTGAERAPAIGIAAVVVLLLAGGGLLIAARRRS